MVSPGKCFAQEKHKRGVSYFTDPHTGNRSIETTSVAYANLQYFTSADYYPPAPQFTYAPIYYELTFTLQVKRYKGGSSLASDLNLFTSSEKDSFKATTNYKFAILRHIPHRFTSTVIKQTTRC